MFAPVLRRDLQVATVCRTDVRALFEAVRERRTEWKQRRLLKDSNRERRYRHAELRACLCADVARFEQGFARMRAAEREPLADEGRRRRIVGMAYSRCLT